MPRSPPDRLTNIVPLPGLLATVLCPPEGSPFRGAGHDGIPSPQSLLISCSFLNGRTAVKRPARRSRRPSGSSWVCSKPIPGQYTCATPYTCTRPRRRTSPGSTGSNDGQCGRQAIFISDLALHADNAVPAALRAGIARLVGVASSRSHPGRKSEAHLMIGPVVNPPSVMRMHACQPPLSKRTTLRLRTDYAAMAKTSHLQQHALQVRQSRTHPSAASRGINATLNTLYRFLSHPHDDQGPR
jgi:hypothetical protein